MGGNNIFDSTRRVATSRDEEATIALDSPSGHTWGGEQVIYHAIRHVATPRGGQTHNKFRSTHHVATPGRRTIYSTLLAKMQRRGGETKRRQQFEESRNLHILEARFDPRIVDSRSDMKNLLERLPGESFSALHLSPASALFHSTPRHFS